jgi:hypothetical protein
MPEGYGAVCDLISAMRCGLVGPFSWAEWQDLPAVFCRRLKIAMPVIADVAKYRGGQGG